MLTQTKPLRSLEEYKQKMVAMGFEPSTGYMEPKKFPVIAVLEFHVYTTHLDLISEAHIYLEDFNEQ